LQCGAGAWLKELASGDQRRPTGSGIGIRGVLQVTHSISPRLVDFYLLSSRH